MRRAAGPVLFVVLLFASGLAAAGWYVFQTTPSAAPPDAAAAPAERVTGGKLVVLLVFDQMRGSYLDRWAGVYGPDGFERMKKGGVWYSDAHLPYASSSTGPGHASLVTGAPPAAHGIVENDWLDKSDNSRVYCVQPYARFDRVPPSAAGPSRGQELGVSPERLLVPTVGDALSQATAGKGRVVSLSIKDRTAVLMGGKQPTAAYWFDNRAGEFHTSSYYRPQAHPWVTELNASKLVNRWFQKSDADQWHRLRADLDYKPLSSADDAAGEGRGFYGQGRVFPHPMRGSTEPAPGPQYYTILETSPFGNELLLELAKKAVTAEGLGRGEAPDLLCVSFSSNDLIGHFWGPDSQEVLDVTLRADRLVADLLTFLDGAVGRDNYTVVMSADHGACPIPEQEADRHPEAARVRPGDVMQELSAAMDDTFGRGDGERPQWFVTGDPPYQEWPWVSLNRRVLDARRIPVEAAAEYAAQWLSNRPYMEAAYTRRRIETGSLPPGTVGDKVRLAYHPDRCGDVLAVAKPYVLVTGYPAGTSHGSPHPYDTHVPVVAYGAGVPPLGRRTDKVSSLVVAPTLAWALGVPPPPAAVEKVPDDLRRK